MSRGQAEAHLVAGAIMAGAILLAGTVLPPPPHQWHSPSFPSAVFLR